MRWFRPSAIDGAGNTAGSAGESGIVVLTDGSTMRFASPEGTLTVLAINDSQTVAGVHRASEGFNAFTWSPGSCPD